MPKIKIPKELSLAPVPAIRHYYVDEAGDPTLFSSRGGKDLVGTFGCSRYFIIGLLSAFEPVSLETDLKALNRIVLADTALKWRGDYLKPVLGFHAKDDLPEVREMVFNLLAKQKFRFFAVVKDKIETLKYVRQMNQTDPEYHYDGDMLYDSLVKSLFQTRLHKNYHCNVHFAQRGPVDRTAALRNALQTVQAEQKALYNPKSTGTMKIFDAATLGKNVNLQAVDYCLWAVQRFYEKNEEKYIKRIIHSASMIYELDSNTGKKHGQTYTRKKHPFGC